MLTIEAGYRPGIIGRVAEMHALYYSRHYDFGYYFECLVASGMSQFIPRLGPDRPNHIWAALDGERVVGSISLDGEDLGGGIAHLRWFVMDDGYRGTGMGRKLLAEALAFADKNRFDAVRLWTFQSLDAARYLYEQAGFVLVEEKEGESWGTLVTEQCFERPRPR